MHGVPAWRSERPYFFLGAAFFLPAFLPFLPFALPLLATATGFGFSRLNPELALGGQPAGRPRSYGPEIACTIAPFSRYVYVTVSSGSTRGSTPRFPPIANCPVTVSYPAFVAPTQLSA